MAFGCFVICVALIGFGTGCQSTSHQDSIHEEPLADQTLASPAQEEIEENFLSHWLATTIEYIEALNEQGRFREAKPYLELRREITDQNLFTTSLSFDRRALQALLKFFDDPTEGLALASELQPLEYSESGLKALLLGHMNWVLQDCEQAVNEMSKFSPMGIHDSGAWSRKIWNMLNSWCLYRVHEDMGEQTESASNWWEVTHLVGTAISPEERFDRFEQWATLNPHHLASRFPPVELFSERSGEPNRIALLLPQSGPLSSASRAIRNGFLAAHLTHIKANQDLTIEFYDSEEDDIALLVDQVIDDGVDVIVGPLDKDRVRRLVQADPLAVPIIALNRVPDSTISNNFSVQLGLVVEDDVAAIASRLEQMRAKRILLFLGRDFWCARATVALRETLRHGMTIADEAILNDLSEVTETVSQSLLVAQSNTRHLHLENLIGDLGFNARRRHDIDAIVAFVDYAEFGSLTAALQYHFAGDIPILVAEPTIRNREQQVEYENGTLFTSTPAMLYPPTIAYNVHDSFADADGLFPLYAFGIDAYRVAMNIPRLLQGESIYGLTGVLSIQQPGVIVRQPIWGMIARHSLTPAPVVSFPSQTQSPTLLNNLQ